MTQKFDLVVIGTGKPDLRLPSSVSRMGSCHYRFQTFGGTCALRGCTPKKVLVNAAELIDWLQRMEGRAFTRHSHRWSALMRFKEHSPSLFPQRTVCRCRNRHVPRAGAFVAQTTAQVGDDTLGRYILIATGAKPAELGIPGEELLTISDQFLELEQLNGIIFVGGGYISFEFAHVAARVGAQIQILHDERSPTF